MSAIRFLRGVLLLAACTIPLSGFTQDEVETDADSAALTLGDIVVVGTRVRGVAVEDLAVPVDVYDIQEITTTGSEDLLTVALQKTSPSFNSKRNALGDGGLFHTAALRGMSADHTLVLVNGKRRHSISFPRPLETAGQGTTGADLRAIPLAAIERIEVLRDGAATQYGSDAIGGSHQRRFEGECPRIHRQRTGRCYRGRRRAAFRRVLQCRYCAWREWGAQPDRRGLRSRANRPRLRHQSH